jgi:hypothetical protein
MVPVKAFLSLFIPVVLRRKGIKQMYNHNKTLSGVQGELVRKQVD